jgi:hypothetical protein
VFPDKKLELLFFETIQGGLVLEVHVASRNFKVVLYLTFKIGRYYKWGIIVEFK